MHHSPPRTSAGNRHRRGPAASRPEKVAEAAHSMCHTDSSGWGNRTRRAGAQRFDMSCARPQEFRLADQSGKRLVVNSKTRGNRSWHSR